MDAWLGLAEANARLAEASAGSDSETYFEQAKDAFETAINLEPTRAESYLALADLYEQHGQPEKAMTLLETVPSNIDDPDSIAKRMEELQKQYFPPMATTVIFDHQFVDGTETSDGGGEEFAVITGNDDNGITLWSITTGHYGAAQLDQVSEIGIRNDMYYYVEDGAVITLDLTDGTQIWRNADFNGGLSGFDFGNDGTLYICGYLGPDFYAVDKDGRTLSHIESFDPDYYWAYGVKCDGDQVLVTMEGSPMDKETVFCVNSKDYSYQREMEPVSEGDLLSQMQSLAGYQMEEYVYVDMDHDGASELIGVYADYDGIYHAWYCSSDGTDCRMIYEAESPMEECNIELLEYGQETHVAVDTYMNMGTMKYSSVFGMQDHAVECLIFEQWGYISMNDKGEVLLDVEAYDGTYDPDIGVLIGHTWKDTYLFYDGTEYREYGANEISEDEFHAYINADVLLNEIEQELVQENTAWIDYCYFIRANGIIHIQCNVTDAYGFVEYGYYTIRYSGSVLDKELGAYTAGQMEPSFSTLDVVW